MNYALTEMNFADEGRVITALSLRYLYLGDTWGSGKIHDVSRKLKSPLKSGQTLTIDLFQIFSL
jgi:hypothetical protein